VGQFRDELVRYRKALAAQNIVEPDRQIALDVVDRWSEHGAIETLWQTLVEKLGAEAIPEPANLIDLVIERRLKAAELEKIETELPRQESMAKSRIKRDLQDRRYDAVAGVSVLLHGALEGRRRILGRQKGGFRRKYFIMNWSLNFQDLCGSPLDEVVATITEIAFGNHGIPPKAARSGKHSVVEEVRDARRRASGTRDRDTRRPK
jgi:hypothetical protein